MKIGIDIRAVGRQRTGDETYTLQLVRHLARIDKENSYFLYTDTKDPDELTKIEQILGLKNDNFSVIGVVPASKALWTFWALPRQARSDQLDILHVQYITPVKVAFGTKLVTTIHDISFARYPEFIDKKDLFFLKILIPPSLQYANKIITVSNFTKTEVEEFYKVPSEKIVAVQNGGAEEEFFAQPSEDEKSRLQKELKINGDFILYAGTLQPRKNIPELVEAFGVLKESYVSDVRIQGLKLVIGGNRDGHNYDQKIDRVVADLPKEIREQVVFAGFIEQEIFPAVFRSAELFCFPSFYEGFGLPVIEAMASGTPTVCNDNSCFDEVAGNAALIYKKGDRKDLVEKLYRALTDERLHEDLVAKGKERAKIFSWEKAARETLMVYKSLVQ